MNTSILFSSALLAVSLVSCAQKEQKMKPEDTEVWEPVPAVVISDTAPGTAEAAAPAPSDALVLFNGKNLDQWESVDHPGSPASGS